MKYELKKLLSRGFLLFVGVCVAANAFFFYQEKTSRNQELLEDYSYYQEIVERMKTEQDLDLSLFQVSDFGAKQHRMAVYTAETQQRHFNMYPNYILTMPERARAAESLSASGSSAFSGRNIEKTVADFHGFEEIPISIDLEIAVTQVYQFQLADILFTAFVLLLCVMLFSTEYEKGMFVLLLATPSRARIALSKLGVLVVGIGVMCVLLYGGNLLVANQVFGLGDMSRPVQSLDAFRTCPFRISCGEYLLLGVGIKFLSASALGALLLALYSLWKKSVYVVLFLVVLLGSQFVLYVTVQVSSVLNAFRFINVFHMMDSFAILSRYQNVNLFGYPVSAASVNPYLLLVVFAVGCGLFVFRVVRGSVASAGQESRIVNRVLDGARRLLDDLHRHSFVFLHEARKILLGGKALVILLLLLAFMWNQYQDSYRVKFSQDEAYEFYMKKLGGEITEETFVRIEEERRRLMEQNSLGSSASEAVYSALSEIESQVYEMQWMENRTGFRAYLVPQPGYAQLMGTPPMAYIDCLLVLAAILLGCSGVFSRENMLGTKNLIRICKRGNRPPLAKFVLVCLVSAAAVAIVFGFRYAMVAKDYPLSFQSAPLQNLRIMQNSPLPITIQQALWLVWGIRLLIAAGLSAGICAVSSVLRGDSSSVVVSVLVFAFPVVAVMSGMSVLENVSFFPGLNGFSILADSRFVYLFGIAAVGGLALWVVRRRWRV